MYEEISVNEKITLMNELFEQKSECMFSDLITRANNEMDIVCAFMAILEAVKFKMITIYQHRLFGDIKLCKREEIHDEIINVALMAASKIVEREINKEDNEKLVEDFLNSK